MNGLDPPLWDVVTTRLLAGTLLRPFWGGWVRRLDLRVGETVLDFGSGSGQLSRRLAQAVGPTGHVTCLDISTRWLEIAREELEGLPWVDLRLGTLAPLPWGAYDLVHVHYVLHGIPRGLRGSTAEELSARIRPGGRLAIREPLYYGPLPMVELQDLFARVGLTLLREPQRHWWLAGPVVESFFVKLG